MTITAVATILGNKQMFPQQSIVRDQIISSTVGSVETLRVLHQLGRSPDKVTPVLRSVVGVVSAGIDARTPALAAVTWDATAVTLVQSSEGVDARWDVLCEVVHSIVR